MTTRAHRPMPTRYEAWKIVACAPIIAMLAGAPVAAQPSPATPPPPPPPSPRALNFSPVYDVKCDMKERERVVGTIEISITSRAGKRYAKIKSSDESIFKSNRRLKLEQPTTAFSFDRAEKVAYSDRMQFTDGGKRYSLFILFNADDQFVRAGAYYYPEGGGEQTSVRLNDCLLTKAMTK